MVQPVAVVFVHGINTHEAGYEKPMQQAILAKLPKAVRPHVTFKAVYWAERVRQRQQQYLDAVAERGLFNDNNYRRLVVQGLGDAAAYQKTRSVTNSAYFQIQSDVRAVLDELDQEGMPDRPLVFIGHSLGCHIISSFAWDLNSVKQWGDGRIAGEDDKQVIEFAHYLRNGSPFRRLDTLAGLVMMGSNMPLFTFTFGPDRVFPITSSRGAEEKPAFPGRALDDATLERARWVNYYSRNDLLGFPLKPLNAAYNEEPRLKDIEVASEGLWRRFWSLFFAPTAAYAAHTRYWTNRRVVAGAAGLIESIATANDPVPPSRFGFARKPAR